MYSEQRKRLELREWNGRQETTPGRTAPWLKSYAFLQEFGWLYSSLQEAELFLPTKLKK